MVPDNDVILGYKSLQSGTQPLVLGPRARLRSDTVVYVGAESGSGFQTGHPIVVRQSTMTGPSIKTEAQIGVNATILPYVTIGAASIVGAGSMVTSDVPPGTVAYGSSAVPTRRVKECPDIEARLPAAHCARMASRFGVVAGEWH